MQASQIYRSSSFNCYLQCNVEELSPNHRKQNCAKHKQFKSLKFLNYFVELILSVDKTSGSEIRFENEFPLQQQGFQNFQTKEKYS